LHFYLYSAFSGTAGTELPIKRGDEAASQLNDTEAKAPAGEHAGKDSPEVTATNVEEIKTTPETADAASSSPTVATGIHIIADQFFDRCILVNAGIAIVTRAGSSRSTANMFYLYRVAVTVTRVYCDSCFRCLHGKDFDRVGQKTEILAVPVKHQIRLAVVRRKTL